MTENPVIESSGSCQPQHHVATGVTTEGQQNGLCRVHGKNSVANGRGSGQKSKNVNALFSLHFRGTCPFFPEQPEVSSVSRIKMVTAETPSGKESDILNNSFSYSK